MDYQQFAKDEKTTFAVVRAIEIIGEVAKTEVLIPIEARLSAIYDLGNKLVLLWDVH